MMAAYLHAVYPDVVFGLYALFLWPGATRGILSITHPIHQGHHQIALYG